MVPLHRRSSQFPRVGTQASDLTLELSDPLGLLVDRLVEALAVGAATGRIVLGGHVATLPGRALRLAGATVAHLGCRRATRCCRRRTPPLLASEHRAATEAVPNEDAHVSQTIRAEPARIADATWAPPGSSDPGTPNPDTKRPDCSDARSRLPSRPPGPGHPAHVPSTAPDAETSPAPARQIPALLAPTWNPGTGSQNPGAGSRNPGTGSQNPGARYTPDPHWGMVGRKHEPSCLLRRA
jgi:hypothetical protein